MPEQKQSMSEKAAKAVRTIKDGAKLAKDVASGNVPGAVVNGIKTALNLKDVIKKIVLAVLIMGLIFTSIVGYIITSLPSLLFPQLNLVTDLGNIISDPYKIYDSYKSATQEELETIHQQLLSKIQKEISESKAKDKKSKKAITYVLNDNYTGISGNAITLAICCYSEKYGKNASLANYKSVVDSILSQCFSSSVTSNKNVVTYTITFDESTIEDAFDLTNKQKKDVQNSVTITEAIFGDGDSDPSSSSGNQNDVVAIAKSMLGVKYVFGGESKEGIDCSGLTLYVYKKAAGIMLPHDALAQSKLGKAVSRDKLEPGDLVFFATEGGNTVTHVGIYIGDNKFIAANTGHKICVSEENLNSAYWSSKYVCARRFLSGASTGLLHFIEQHEGFYGTAYRGVDSWNETIGYGHVIEAGDGLEGKTLTQAQAENLLKKDLVLYEKSVNNEFAGYKLKQCQHDALVDMAYGIGAWGWSKIPKLVADVKAGASSNIMKADFLAVDKVGGKRCLGESNRKYDEWVLYETGNYNAYCSDWRTNFDQG